MEVCQMDQSVKSEMTRIHFGVKVMFTEVQGAFFSNYNLITSSDMLLFCKERPQSKHH